MQKKSREMFFDFEVIAFELVAVDTRFYWERILVIGCQLVNKQSQEFRYYQNRIFWADIFSEWSKNLTKNLPCIIKQWFGPFRPLNVLTLRKCSDMGVFGYLSSSSFCGLHFQEQITFEVVLFFQSILNFM